MCFTLKKGLKTEISPKYCNIKAITHKNNDFQPFFLQNRHTKNLHEKNLKYLQLCTSLSLKFNTC